MKSRLNIGWLLAIFALALLPFAATLALYYTDERHYTDGAMQMLRDHDWLVAKTPENGTTNWLPRFQKPPLAYWATAASYAAFGVNAFAARLPFLLASCGTIFLTWRLARKLTGNATTALLAAIILASHVQFIFAATRAIPDALLIFFVTLGAFGFLRLIAFREFTAGAYWMAYGGAAGAALSKGLLGAGVVLFAWAFVVVRERRLGAVKQLIHVPSLALATALVAAWFGYIFNRYGMAAWNVFFGDQVSGNLHGAWWAPVWRGPLYVAILAANFLPWSLPAIEVWWRTRGAPVSDPARSKNRSALAGSETGVPLAARQFILAWSAVLVVGFAFGENISVRYLLPAAPLLSILVADVLVGGADKARLFAPRAGFCFFLTIVVLLFVGAAWLNWQCGLTLATAGFAALLLAAITVAIWAARGRDAFANWQGTGLLLLLIFPVLFLAICRIALPERTEQMAQALAREKIDSTNPVLFIGSPMRASGLRLFTRGQFTVVRTEPLDVNTGTNFSTILGPESDLQVLAAHGYRLLPAATIPGTPPRAEWWSTVREGRLPEALRNAGEKFTLAVRE